MFVTLTSGSCVGATITFTYGPHGKRSSVRWNSLSSVKERMNFIKYYNRKYVQSALKVADLAPSSFYWGTNSGESSMPHTAGEERKGKKRKEKACKSCQLRPWRMGGDFWGGQFMILCTRMKLQPLGNCHVEPVVGDFGTSPRGRDIGRTSLVQTNEP